MTQYPFPIDKMNQIARLLAQYGFGTDQFYWTQSSQKVKGQRPYLSKDITVPELVYAKHGSYNFQFGISFDRSHEISSFGPGTEYNFQTEKGRDWDDRIVHLEIWLQCLRRELDTPDLWDEWKKAAPLVEVSEGASNNPFTEAEAAAVRRELQSLRDRVGHLPDLSDSDRAWINSRFDSLDREVSRLGRLDWRTLLIGVVMEVGMTQILSQVQWAEIVKLAGRLIHRLFGGPLLPAA